VIALANPAIDDVRRRVQNETLGHRGRSGDPLFEIRPFRILGRGGIAIELEELLRAIRIACREFMTEMEREDEWMRAVLAGVHKRRFGQALGRLRAVVGIHLGQIAVKYGIDVEDELAAILPPVD
jgi:hypothetical protein